eukprot:gene7778-9243_t
MQLVQRRYPTWLPIPPILALERGKVVYGDHVFYIKVSADVDIQRSLHSIAKKIMNIVRRRIARSGDLVQPPNSVPPLDSAPTFDTTPPGSSEDLGEAGSPR